MDHQAEFQLPVLDKFGKHAADNIGRSAPRLFCITADFTKYDRHAVNHFNFLRMLAPVLADVDATSPVPTGVPTSDIVRSDLGLLGLLPSSPTLRQRMDTPRCRWPSA